MTALAPHPAPSRIETEVLRIRSLMGKSQFRAALAAAQSLSDDVPENRDVLYMIAVNQRYLTQIPAALTTLRRLEAVHPGYARLFQERGHCLVAAREPGGAIEAYLRAVNLNPALPASWKALRLLFRAAGEDANAATAASHVTTLQELPVAVVTARSMLAEGEVHEAERVVRRFLQTHPGHIEAMRLLAQIGMQLDVLDDAEFLLESVLVFDPAYRLARYDYCNVLLRRHRHGKALEEADRLLAADPTDRNYRVLRATVLVGMGDHEGALRIYRELSDATPQAADLHLSMAHALKTLGRQPDAIRAYRAAAAVRPDYGDAYWSLANLKTYRFTDDEFSRMREAEGAAATQPVDRYHLCFALGKAAEDRGDHAGSFTYYERGNALKKAETAFRIEPIERNTQLQKRVCTRAFFDARRGAQPDRMDAPPATAEPPPVSAGAVPIFIVGLPRAGSTLLEQVLASHSRVEGTMELADIPRLVQTLQGRDANEAEPRYPGVLAGLTAAELRRQGAKYLEDTRVYRSGKPFFIDKMPNNFRHVGLIHLILPQAKIIDARREPMACCFGNFKQLFASGQEFTYDLEDIARYYRTYVDLMDHWDDALPGRVLRVQHEDLLDDLEANVRRMLAFCGLDFEPACLEFHKNSRSVRTASSEQVRRPLNKEGLDQWRHYEPWLGPLQRALGSLAQSPARTAGQGGTPH